MYTKKFNVQNYNSVQPILDKLQDLQEGEVLRVGCGGNIQTIGRTRWLLYDWIHHMGFRGMFRIRMTSDGLEVTRLPSPSFDLSIERPSLGPLEGVFMNLLRSCANRDAADAMLDTIDLDDEGNEINAVEKKLLFNRWKEIMEDEGR